MTLIENDSPKVQYTGPFIRGQLLPLTFPYIATEDVKMIIDDTPAIFNVDYEIITEPDDEHPVAYPNSAYIKNDLPNAKQITIYRVTPLDQQAPFPQQSKFRSERVEQALDKLTMQQQEQEEQLSRCIIAPITLETFNGQLPAPAADQALKWNTEGTELENYDIIGEQEAFENDVNTRFEEQSTTIENRIGQFEEETNTQFSEFRNEINENLEAVLDAAAKLENLDSSVQAATNAANAALTSATRADEYAEEAFMSADQAEDALEEIRQVIQDAEDTIEELVQNSGFPMFSPQWSDHFYNDASFLRADTFSWHYADMYVTAYEEILKQYNNPEATEQTDGDIIYKLSPDGFRIALASEHDKVLERYLDGEKAWFYILDTENQRFKLPREKKTDGKYLYFYVGIYERPETEVDIGTVTDALNNKVDIDGGNYAGSGLEATINENYTTKSMVDGQWVNEHYQVASSVELPTASPLIYDLSSYLPNDGHSYEVLFGMVLATSSTSSSYARGRLSTDLMPQNVTICSNRVASNSTQGVIAEGNAILPVGLGRTVSIRAESVNSGKTSVSAFGYRRLGTNV